MGMLLTRKRNKKPNGITTTKDLLGVQNKPVENVKPKKEANNIPTQPKFKA